MFGAIVGDIVGSVFKFDEQRTKNFELFDVRGHFSDETIMTIAVRNILKSYIESGKKIDFEAELQEELLRLAWIYPNLSYSRSFSAWMFDEDPKPVPSAGLGCAVRVSGCAEYATSLSEAEEYAQMQAKVTHTHVEGIKGAKCVAAAIYLAKEKQSKDEIKKYIEANYYPLEFNYIAARRQYKRSGLCPQTVPVALMAFLEGENFEDCVRSAIGMGGSEAMAAIAGSIAEAYYGVPQDIKERAILYLDDELRSSLE
jgi:type I restriction enzyme M protein